MRELGLGQKQKEGRMGGKCHGGCRRESQVAVGGLEPQTECLVPAGHSLPLASSLWRGWRPSLWGREVLGV